VTGRTVNTRALALWALTVFVFSIPSENAITIQGLGSLSRLLAIGAFALTIVSLFDRGRFRLRSPPLFVITAFVFLAWVIATYFWSIAPSTSLSRIFTMAQLIVFVWMLHEVPRDDRDRASLMQAFVLGCYLILVVAIGLFFFSPGDYYRQSGPFNPNGLAVVAGLGIPMAWMLALRHTTGAMRWLNMLYPLITLFGIVLAASRGGLLTTLVALLIIPATMPLLGLVRGAAVSIAAVIMAITVITVLPQTFPALERNLDRLAETSDELQGGTLTGRTDIWATGYEIFRENPLFGVGAGGFVSANRMLTGSGKNAHNAFIAVAVGTGIIGLALYVGLFAIALTGILLVRERRLEFLVLFAALVVAMMPTNSDNDKFAWFVLSMLAVYRPIDVRVQPPVLPVAPLEPRGVSSWSRAPR
jgi:O-antigen ligase